ncbi:MAG: hypothetical protein H7844_10890 [Nitrospirae bacterium YQR-1]
MRKQKTNNDDESKVITYYDTHKAAQVTIVRKETEGVLTDVVESISFCFKEGPFPFSEMLSIGDALFPPRQRLQLMPIDTEINAIGVLEYYDARRMATISIVYNDDVNFKPVIALQILFEGSATPGVLGPAAPGVAELHPVSLSSIFNIEKKTFIGMPRGFYGVPIREFEGRPPAAKKGCGGCGKGSLSLENIMTTNK